MWEVDHKESWVPKNWCFWTVVLEKTLASPSDCKEIKPVNPKGNQFWIFSERTDADAEAEAPILWPPDVKNWLIGKEPDSGQDWRQEEKGTTEDEIAGWHHWLDGHEFEQSPGVGDRQGSLVCCSPWGHKESGMTWVTELTDWLWLEWLNWWLTSRYLCHISLPYSKLIPSGLFIVFAVCLIDIPNSTLLKLNSWSSSPSCLIGSILLHPADSCSDGNLEVILHTSLLPDTSGILLTLPAKYFPNLALLSGPNLPSPWPQPLYTVPTCWQLSLLLSYFHPWKVKVKVYQSCLTLCDPMDCIVHGILHP